MSAPKQHAKRIAGKRMQLAARLAETPVTRGLLYAAATKQMGIDQIHELAIPDEAAPYRPVHLNPKSRDAS